MLFFCLEFLTTVNCSSQFFPETSKWWELCKTKGRIWCPWGSHMAGGWNDDLQICVDNLMGLYEASPMEFTTS